MKASSRSRWMLVCSMLIFSTIGLIRRYLPLESSFIALIRGIIGAFFLGIVIFFRKQSLDIPAIRKNITALLASGAAMGFNWILLFEAYRYTSLAVATLCYYLAPVLVVLLSALLLKEVLTPPKLLCTALSLVGMVLVSGILEPQDNSPNQWLGIFFGLAAAALYAAVIITNKKMSFIPAYDKTLIQLSAASIAMLPYVLLTGGIPSAIPDWNSVILLLIAGVVHTGIAYCLYFGSIDNLRGQTIAMLSYLDPVGAVFLSVLVLKEPLSVFGIAGAFLVLGSAFFSERCSEKA